MSPEQNDPAPDFALPADDGSVVKLSHLRGQRVILFFYPRADTPGCTIEACEFRDMTPQIQEKGALVFGLSPDPVEDVRKFREKFNLPYRLLADADHSVAESYGVWKEKTNFGKTYWGVARTTFLVDEQGKIERVYEKVNPEGHAASVLGGLER
ncbi:MAG: thioredoxin-dependent thiol peroxidase [Gemmatimonadetes bacterium]|nr:thioredoxin-dependent thiol peroxidase [Gemmatimonadota bacterium]